MKKKLAQASAEPHADLLEERVRMRRALDALIDLDLQDDRDVATFLENWSSQPRPPTLEELQAAKGVISTVLTAMLLGSRFPGGWGLVEQMHAAGRFESRYVECAETVGFHLGLVETAGAEGPPELIAQLLIGSLAEIDIGFRRLNVAAVAELLDRAVGRGSSSRGAAALGPALLLAKLACQCGALNVTAGTTPAKLAKSIHAVTSRSGGIHGLRTVRRLLGKSTV